MIFSASMSPCLPHIFHLTTTMELLVHLEREPHWQTIDATWPDEHDCSLYAACACNGLSDCTNRACDRFRFDGWDTICIHRYLRTSRVRFMERLK